jgi:limonene-1,2-epoxide hydrolase
MSHAAFRAAIESGDVEQAAAALAPDVVFRSPVVFRPYEGREATMVVLRAVAEVFDDFRYVAEMEGEDGHVLVFEARVGEKQLQGVDWLRFDVDGLVSELTVLIRPMSGLLALAEAMKAKLEAMGAV